MMALAMTAPPAPRYDELDRATLEQARARDPMAMRAFVVRYERAVFALLSRMQGAGRTWRTWRRRPSSGRSARCRASIPTGRHGRRRGCSRSPCAWRSTPAEEYGLPATALDAGLRVVDPKTPETERARRELGVSIARAAASLSDDMRAAFVLADVHGFTMLEVAEALGIPESTAKTRLHRARQHMRDALAAAGESVGARSEGDEDEAG